MGKGVPSHKVIQKEEKFKNKVKKILLSEQPTNLLPSKGTHRKLCLQERKNLEKKIMYSSLKKSCEKLPKTKDKQKKWQLNKTNFYTTAETNSFDLFDDSYRWTFDPGG